MNKETLALLADNGGPLDLEFVPTREGWIMNRDGRSAGPDPELDSRERLEESLAWYPRPVTINGEPLETREWNPDLGTRIDIQLPALDGRSGAVNQVKNNPARKIYSHNARVGGVLTHLQAEMDINRDTYLAPTHSGLPGHDPLAIVAFSVLMQVETAEIAELDESKDGCSRIVPRSPLESRVRDRLQRDQELARSVAVAAGEVNPPHEGKVYRRPMTGENGSDVFTDSYPIAVTARPIVVRDGDVAEFNSEYVSVIENLYLDGRLIPVDERDWINNERVSGPFKDVAEVGAAEFTIMPVDSETPESITLTIETDDEEDPIEIPARFVMTGEFIDEAQVRVVPGALTQEQLAGYVFRGYWTYKDMTSWDDAKYEAEVLMDRVKSMTTYAAGDREGAVERELNMLVNGFHPAVPMPKDRRVSVRNHAGTLEVILNPDLPAEGK